MKNIYINANVAYIVCGSTSRVVNVKHWFIDPDTGFVVIRTNEGNTFRTSPVNVIFEEQGDK